MPIIIDQLQREVNIPENPTRIISLVPSQTELLYDLGLTNEVIGITKFCIHPQEWFRSKTRIGGTKNVNIDTIIELQPDLIIANKEENTKEDIDKLSLLFPVWISDIKNLEDNYQMIQLIGQMVNKEIEAKKITQSIKTAFKQLTFDNIYKTTYFIWYNPWMAAGKGTFIDEIMKLAGFENTVSEFRYPSVTIADLQAELLLFSSEPYPFKEKHCEQLKIQLPNAKCFIVDGELFSWYGSRMQKTPDYLIELRKKIKASFKEE